MGNGSWEMDHGSWMELGGDSLEGEGGGSMVAIGEVSMVGIGLFLFKKSFSKKKDY